MIDRTKVSPYASLEAPLPRRTRPQPIPFCAVGEGFGVRFWRTLNLAIDQRLSTNNLVNSLFPHCFFRLHLTSTLGFGLPPTFFPTSLTILHLPNNKLTLINVFLQAKI
mgnify:CR=1 FL=1